MALLSQIASSFSKRDYRKRDRVIRRIDLLFGAICGEWLNRAIPHMSHKNEVSAMRSDALDTS
jgi:hypothetical protein